MNQFAGIVEWKFISCVIAAYCRGSDIQAISNFSAIVYFIARSANELRMREIGSARSGVRDNRAKSNETQIVFFDPLCKRKLGNASSY